MMLNSMYRHTHAIWTDGAICGYDIAHTTACYVTDFAHSCQQDLVLHAVQPELLSYVFARSCVR